MPEHNRTNQEKTTTLEKGSRQKAEPVYGHPYAWEQGLYPLIDTPFQPRMDEHAELLKEARSDLQRAGIVMRLQHTYGNRYIQRLLDSMGVQTKLTVSQPDDAYEQEADRVADMVTRNLMLQRQEEEEGEEEEEERTQTKLILQRQEEEEGVQIIDGNKVWSVPDELETRINNERGSGQFLSEEIRAPMERAFGADFSNVRVHTDSESDSLNSQLNAKAFTRGQDIFFKNGEYSPGSDSGKRLIAHELTHTIQQGTSSRIAKWGGKGTPHEQVTKDAFKEGGFDKEYDKEAQDYIASFTDRMDYRFRMWWSWSTDKLANIPAVLKMKKDPEAYKNLEGYDLDEDEALNHAEGGLYKSESGEGANKARAQQRVDEAIAAWKGDNTNLALSTLGLGLHTAEDRGSHGEGKPGLGHDPRRRIPAPENYKGVKYYEGEDWKDFWCDTQEHNRGGYRAAIKYAVEVLQQFYDSVKQTEEPEGSFIITLQPPSLLYPRWMEKFVRKLAILFGTQPEEIAALFSEKLKAMEKWSEEKLTALINWSAEKLKALMSWSADKLSALGKWSIEKLTELAKWSVEKLTSLASWSVDKLEALGKWSIEKLTELASWTAEKLTSLASWSVKKLNSITGWITGRLRALASIFS